MTVLLLLQRYTFFGVCKIFSFYALGAMSNYSGKLSYNARTK